MYVPATIWPRCVCLECKYQVYLAGAGKPQQVPIPPNERGEVTFSPVASKPSRSNPEGARRSTPTHCSSRRCWTGLPRSTPRRRGAGGGCLGRPEDRRTELEPRAGTVSEWASDRPILDRTSILALRVGSRFARGSAKQTGTDLAAAPRCILAPTVAEGQVDRLADLAPPKLRADLGDPGDLPAPGRAQDGPQGARLCWGCRCSLRSTGISTAGAPSEQWGVGARGIASSSCLAPCSSHDATSPRDGLRSQEGPGGGGAEGGRRWRMERAAPPPLPPPPPTSSSSSPFPSSSSSSSSSYLLLLLLPPLFLFVNPFPPRKNDLKYRPGRVFFFA